MSLDLKITVRDLLEIRRRGAAVKKISKKFRQGSSRANPAYQSGSRAVTVILP